MSLTFPTTTQKKPSGLTALPNQMKRPAFGTLHGFDAQGGASSGPFNVETIDTTSNLAARTGDAEGFLAFDKTTGQLYVAYGSNLWTKHGAD